RARRPGGAFFAPGFFAQAKKGGSRRHGAKALDLDVGERAAGQDPPYEALAERQAGQDPPHTAAGAVGTRATRCARTLIRRFAPPSPASGRRAVWLLSRKREKGCLAELPQAGEGLFDRAPAGGRRAAPPLWKRLWPTVALPWRREPEVKARGCSRSHEGLGGYPNIARIDASSGCSTMPFSVTMASTSAAGV